jgi:hypothetical protein
MYVGRRSHESLTTSARLLILCLLLTVLFCAIHAAAHAQSADGPFPVQRTEDARAAAAEFGRFRFNDRKTTPFGPAYADIWLRQQNFLACKPPLGRPFTYALCLFSGPAVGTPVPTNGSKAVNPALPCKLSADGKSADCTCYALTTEQYPPYVPYFVDINAILNLDLYLRTVGACGHEGENCSPREPIRAYSWWNDAPVCRAANAGRVIPGTDLISVFSTVKSSGYATGASPNSTSCTTGKYAGCMTAPCRHTGKKDSAGNELVQCQCPVYDGPYELSQAGVPCDANELTSPAQGSRHAVPPPVYVWSAAHNPALNHGSIDPPAMGCLPDAPAGKGCPLYSPEVSYPVAKHSPLCREVCEAYRRGAHPSQSPYSSAPRGVQIGYTCDAALCTTLGIGQTSPAPRDPPGKAELLQSACGGLAELNGLRAILALEQIDQVSCGASQVCGCDEPGTDISAATQAEITGLNQRQEALGIEPQCQINGTLCGTQK